jgi:UDP-glucose 4-epimerase
METPIKENFPTGATTNPYGRTKYFIEPSWWNYFSSCGWEKRTFKCIWWYIHVKAIVNLGTGKGYSVLDMVKAFENASDKKVAYKIVDRRAGDIAKEVLDWEAKRTIEDMCTDGKVMVMIREQDFIQLLKV